MSAKVHIRKYQFLFFSQCCTDPAGQAAPEVLPDEHHWEAGHLVGLDQGERFKELVKGAEASRHNHEAVGVLQKHGLAGEEVTEMHSQVDELVHA